MTIVIGPEIDSEPEGVHGQSHADDLLIKEAKQRRRRRRRILVFLIVLISLIGLGIYESRGGTPKRFTSKPLGSAAPRVAPVSTPCDPGQLTLSFRGGGVGAGINFGFIIVRDTGASACLLSGPIRVTALTIDRQPIAGATGLGSVTIDPAIAMTANAALWPEGKWPSGHTTAAEIKLGGEARDNPTTGLICAPQLEVYPSYWQVIVAGGTWDVLNDDPGVVSSPETQQRVDGCLANFTTLNVGAISAPLPVSPPPHP